jgi:hypothetical protein
MKSVLLSLCLFLLVGLSAAAQSWPRNAKTGLVEFKGEKVLSVSSPQAHRDSIQARLDRWRARADDNRFANAGQLSDAGTLYGGCTLTPVKGEENGYNFLFMVRIKQTPKGFSYTINGFSCIYSRDQKPESILLDALLSRQDNPYDWLALRGFRKRFDELLSTL